jgi:hypothetical protein
MKIQCQTLFEITATGVTGHIKPGRMPFYDQADNRITDTQSWNRSRNQQRNWETVTQLIGLRTQTVNLTTPAKINNQWQFEFEVDNENLFLDDLDPLAVLKADCTGVPMLTGLTETPALTPLLAIDSNIWFTIIPINKS